MKTVVNGVMEEVVGLSCEEQGIIRADMIKEELLKDKVEIIKVNNGGKHEDMKIHVDLGNCVYLGLPGK